MNKEYVFGGEDIISTNSLDEKTKDIVSITEQLLAKKRSSLGEIILTLFENCNLTCKFCNQDHNSWVGIDTIDHKFFDVVKAIETLTKMRKTHFTVNFMGGEIFQDSITDETFEAYANLVRKLFNWSIENSKPIKFGFISNLVHFNTNRVKTFLDILKSEGIEVWLGTSYDPHSRFNKTNLEIFGKNLRIYKEYLEMVNVVLTAPNIKKFLNNDIPHFDYLYENHDVIFDYYTPEDNFELNSPKDSDLRDMFVFLADKYPKSYPITEWINSKTNPMTCQSTYTIMPDGKAGRCTILLSNFDKEKATKTANEMEHKFISKMDCLSCEYFNQCGLGCYLQQHFNGPNRTMNHCFMKDVHKFIGDLNV